MILECNGKRAHCRKLVVRTGVLDISVHVDDRDDLGDRGIYPEDLRAGEVIITDDDSLQKACHDFFNADHYDHFATRMSDSEMDALDRIQQLSGWAPKFTS
jgi:hypothetical protein